MMALCCCSFELSRWWRRVSDHRRPGRARSSADGRGRVLAWRRGSFGGRMVVG